MGSSGYVTVYFKEKSSKYLPQPTALVLHFFSECLAGSSGPLIINQINKQINILPTISTHLDQLSFPSPDFTLLFGSNMT